MRAPVPMFLACAAAGFVLIIAGLFTAPVLIFLGAVLIVAGPLAYAASETADHPPKPISRTKNEDNFVGGFLATMGLTRGERRRDPGEDE